MKIPDDLFKNHRFSTEIIQYAVWLYFVFSLSFRDVELLLHQRGIVVSYETIRAWCYKFGPHFARQVRQKRRTATDSKRNYFSQFSISSITSFIRKSTDSQRPPIDGNLINVVLLDKLVPQSELMTSCLSTALMRGRVIGGQDEMFEA